MSIKEKLLGKTEVTRRTFLKGASAAGAAAALYGCGGGKGKTYMEEDTDLSVPSIDGKIVPGATPHNCGGRCVSRYYVVDGVVKRIVTDEHTESGTFGDTNYDPQRRSCVRCHSRKQWFYRNDRITSPLKQTKNRGDITGFQKISWEQAYQEIGAKLSNIISTYGSETVHAIYGSADNSTNWAPNSIARLLNLFGGSLQYRNDYSWPAIEHVSPFVEGYWMDASNSRRDVLNAEHLFIWSFNPMEAIWGTQTNWYLTQIRDKGEIPITVVDTRFSKTASVLDDADFVSISPCTDSALMLAVMYELLVNKFTASDITFIKTYVHGFFDDAANGVPAGASLSAYIMGNTAHAENAAASIYPATIGYNVNSTDGLYGKRTNIYGQTPKTPEWAAAITGVSAAKIREIANILYTKKCTLWVGSGYQRNTESEQNIWLMRIMTAVTKNFGQAGCGEGMQEWTWVSGPDTGMGLSSAVDVSSQIYDATELTQNIDWGTRNSLPVFIILDAIENGGTGTSRWNDGQVKKLQKGIKCVMNFAGNAMANQNGDVNLAKQILSDKTKAELLVTCDFFMTDSAFMSDYVLPAQMQMEKPGAATGWFTEEILCISDALDAPGEAQSEYDICAGIADAMGKGSEFTEGKTMEDRLKAGWAAGGYSMTWDEFKEAGIYKPEVPTTIRYQAFRNDPVANPLSTATGKFEAYSLAMMEDYQARGYDNFDSTGTLVGGGLIIDAKHPTGSNSMRFVYPIPMYIPTVEGRHADGSHPDPLGLETKGYKFTLHTWHMQYRSHSTLNNVAYLDECYKKDADGQPAYLNPARAFSDGVWDDGVYEPIWVNGADAQSLGIQTGDRVLVSNDRGQAYASAIVTQRVPSGILGIGQGGWHYKVNGIDVGGCANTLTQARPARICQGMTLANDCRVKIVKA